MLPKSYEPLLRQLSDQFPGDAFVFPGDKTSRHICPRTGERAVAKAAKLAGIRKRVTPHSFRHAFATHLLEHGTDIRFIQKLLGHVRLETATIYTKVAAIKQTAVASPIDRLHGAQTESPAKTPGAEPVGRMSLSLTPLDSTKTTAAAVITIRGSQPVRLDGIRLSEARPGWIVMQLPPSEHWDDRLRVLDSRRRERIESAEFCQLLQSELSRRFLAMQSSS